MLWSSSPTAVKMARLAGDQLQQLVLHAVGVLVLVDEDVAQPLAPRVAHLASRAEQLRRQDDQVVEVDRLVGGEPLLVALHHARRDERVGGAALVAADAAAERPRRRRRRRRGRGSSSRRSPTASAARARCRWCRRRP
jgi:hypothetical protein